MSDLIYRGKMAVWKDDRGFGFIEPENGNPNIFIHISALKKMPRRPVAGDTILYKLSADKEGKPKAADAVIEGLRPVTGRRGRISGHKRTRSGLKKIIFLLFILFSVFLYRNMYGNRNIFEDIAMTVGKTFKNADITKKIENIRKPEANSPVFECQGKTRCSQMDSCEEAMFYLRECPGVKIDGDNDGIPCEHELCGG